MGSRDRDPNVDKVEEDWRTFETRACRWKLGSNKWFRLDFNPIVTFLSAAIIWALVIWCILQPDTANAEITSWIEWITDTSTWLYVGTQQIWFIFILYILFTKYGNLKMGRDDEEPEFSNASYFAMLFAAGIGIGMFYYGVAEPILHYAPGPWGNRFWDRYSDNQRAQDAINLSLFHWGIHGWIVFVVVGMNLGFVAYRWNLPMTIRTCFYPIIGDKIYGWIGDAIDVLSVVASMYGVCTSLGMGVSGLNAGLHRLNSDIEETTRNQVIIIWSVTALATISVVSGIHIGIRRLSEICFGLGSFIMLVVLFYDDTWYLLNVYVQSCGYYLQYILQLGCHTDAFAQQDDAPDGKSAPNWMNGWTVFLWGWWIAWSPFIGMFLAKISRGRTLKEFITYGLTVPCIYIFFWFCVFGGVALKMERAAENMGIQCTDLLGGTNSTEANNGIWRLSCRSQGEMWYDVMTQYEGLGTFLSILSVAGLILYFVTSSDSGSLVIDCLCANGHPDPPMIQRLFWALTEGATATALLVAGGQDALAALQSTSIASALPYTIIVNFMCMGIYRSVKVEMGELDLHGPAFSVDIIDTFMSPKRWPKLLLCIIAPWFFFARPYAKVTSTRVYMIVHMVVLCIMFYAIWLLVGLHAVQPGLAYVGAAISIFWAFYAGMMRTVVREHFSINGNMVEDLFVVLFLYPCAAYQMDQHLLDVEEEHTVPSVTHVDVPRHNNDLQPDLPPSYYKSEPQPRVNEAYVLSEMPRESVHL